MQNPQDLKKLADMRPRSYGSDARETALQLIRENLKPDGTGKQAAMRLVSANTNIPFGTLQTWWWNSANGREPSARAGAPRGKRTKRSGEVQVKPLINPADVKHKTRRQKLFDALASYIGEENIDAWLEKRIIEEITE